MKPKTEMFRAATASFLVLLAITEAPDDETCARLTRATGALGNARTETLKAFGEAEYRKIINSLA